MSDVSGDLWIRDEFTPSYFWHDTVAILLLTILDSQAIVLFVTSNDTVYTYELSESDFKLLKDRFFKLC